MESLSQQVCLSLSATKQKRALCQQQATIMLAVVSKNSSISLCLSQSVVSLYLSESHSLYPYAKKLKRSFNTNATAKSYVIRLDVVFKINQ